jgi:hypothetical protein
MTKCDRIEEFGDEASMAGRNEGPDTLAAAMLSPYSVTPFGRAGVTAPPRGAEGACGGISINPSARLGILRTLAKARLLVADAA